MKKKELKQRIYDIETDNCRLEKQLESNQTILESLVKSLRDNGIGVDITFPKPPMIEVTTVEGNCRKFIEGIEFRPPVITFDFTGHDLMVLEKHKEVNL